MSAATPEASRSPCVLIVDDDARNLKLARDVLAAAGFQTLEAGAGAEAIMLATERLPDVILMDLRLPDMEGAVAVRRLGAAACTAEIPVVALSAVPLEHRSGWSGSGFAGHLAKPIDVRAFPDQVRSFCAHSAA